MENEIEKLLDLAENAGDIADDYSSRDTWQLIHRFADELRRLNTGIAEVLECTLWTDGEHHKQWGLEQIADLFGIENDHEGIAP